jgi:hypothetical protein
MVRIAARLEIWIPAASSRRPRFYQRAEGSREEHNVCQYTRDPDAEGNDIRHSRPVDFGKF